MPVTPEHCHSFPVGNFTAAQRMLCIAIVSSICFVLGSSLAIAGEPLTQLDRKSFNTVPFNPTPSEAQRHELERAIAHCVQTVDQEVPTSHFEAFADRGVVNTVGNDREKFTFWKCMSKIGHPLTPIKK
jgi:hypothetical protein